MRSRRRPIARKAIVPLTTPEDLLITLRDHGLLSSEDIHTLEVEISRRTREVSEWVEELVGKKMLTSYQAELLLEGRGADLVLGPFVVLDWLGAGGMGQVYKAEHRLMKRVVALKVMTAELPTDRDSPGPSLSPRIAFLREVQAAGRLLHPHIVTAFDAAEIDELLVLVMEYVEGIDLERLVEENGPLPISVACEWIRQAAVGLQYAHERGLVHGDVKPSNLLVCSEELLSTQQIKLLDLGLARLAGRPREDRGTTTQTGLEGTPDYMAPELAHDIQQASSRSDLYSLGCTFFYLLTGRVPFPAETWTEKLLQHQFDRPPLASHYRPEVSPAVDAILHRLLAKDPAHRYPCSQILANELQEFLASQLTPDGPEGIEEEPGAWREVTAASNWDHTDLLATVSNMMMSSVSEATPSEPGDGDGFHVPDYEKDAKPEELIPVSLSAPSAWRRLPLAIALLAAVGTGLLAAGILHWSQTGQEVEPTAVSASLSATKDTIPNPPLTFEVQRDGSRHSSLASAVHATQDNDTITIHGSHRSELPPLSWSTKALTLRAAPGSRPRLQWIPSASDPTRSAMLATDRPLVVEGLELVAPTETGCAHLIYSDGASLELKDCVLEARQGSALVVVRCGGRVEVVNSRFIARTLALCVEVGDEAVCPIRIARSRMEIKETGGAAMSLWASEDARPARGLVNLEENQFQADRVLAVRSLSKGMEVHARGNQFVFRQALLSFSGFFGPDGWQRSVSWHDHENQYPTSANWVQVDGSPISVPSLEEWKSLGKGAGEVALPPSR